MLTLSEENHLVYSKKFQIKELEEEREAAKDPASVAGKLQVLLMSLPADALFLMWPFLDL